MYTKPPQTLQPKTLTGTPFPDKLAETNTDATAREATARALVDGRGSAGASCNTYPQNTEHPQPPTTNRVIVDWLEFTLSDDFLIHDRYCCLKQYIQMSGFEFVTAPRGMHGYKTQILYGKARILLDGMEGMGVHVILCGEALQEMKNDPLNLLHWVLHEGGKFTRIDLALDDVTGSLSVSRLNNCLDSGLISCRAKQARYMEGKEISTGKSKGATLYFGSAKSRTQYRVYDKAAQLEIEGHWTRIEGEYRQENAHAVALTLHKAGLNVGYVFSGLVRGFLNVHDPSETDTNRSRWSVAGWWLALLDNVEKLKLSVLKAPKTLQKKRNWFKKYMSPTFAMMFDAFGPDEMLEMYKHGKARLTKEQRRMCAIPF